MYSAKQNGGVMSPATPQSRELAARESDGIHVLLLWHPDGDAVTVSVEDARAGDRFHIAVAPARALDAFYHPFAYAA
jgi:alkanesulfonate monooxygenase SsuD/methylene tetrahydromethanopterin reductase-like flavin-dependent oxidoreductase (luciferase family)